MFLFETWVRKLGWKKFTITSVCHVANLSSYFHLHVKKAASNGHLNSQFCVCFLMTGLRNYGFWIPGVFFDHLNFTSSRVLWLKRMCLSGKMRPATVPSEWVGTSLSLNLMKIRDWSHKLLSFLSSNSTVIDWVSTSMTKEIETTELQQTLDSQIKIKGKKKKEKKKVIVTLHVIHCI